MKIGKNFYQRKRDSGVYPVFTLELNRRVKNKEACNVVIVGEAGSGKSYMAIQLAQGIDAHFGIDQIVFTYKEYVEEIKRGEMGMPIVFDEPSYAMGKREWYKQINQALVKTIESQRFLVRPLLIPIINQALLDKTIRKYCIQFQVHVTKRGKAIVYRLRPSQANEKLYRYTYCHLSYPNLDFDRCKKASCLDCRDLDTCDTLRAQYERKKEDTQLSRYDEGLELASKIEAKEMTIPMMVELIYPLRKLFTTDKKINVKKLKYVLYQKGIKVHNNKAYDIRTWLEETYPEDFTKK